MAGIGFELRKHLQKGSYTGMFQAYGYAGVISAGPWILSILGVMLIGVIGASLDIPTVEIRQFSTSVTWLMGTSLILTGLLQLMFTRFVADRLFEKHLDRISANLMGAIWLTTLVSGTLGLLSLPLFTTESFSYQVLMVANFVVLSNIWIVVIFVAGAKHYRMIVLAFLFGYTLTVIAALGFRALGQEGLLLGLLIGHSLLLFLLLFRVLQDYPAIELARFDFLKKTQIHLPLIAIGFFYNLGIWIDKFLFWLTPATSEAIVGPLRASLIYDFPIFLAYLSIIPGMAVFLLKIETDFAQAYERFYDAVRGTASLREIEYQGNEMIIAVREGIYQIIKVQGMFVLILFLSGPYVIEWLDASQKYIHLYYIDLTGVAMQVLMLAILNVLFYLDKLKEALRLTTTLLISNALFTLVTLKMGPIYYGYGFGLSMTLTTFYGLYLLSKEMEDLEYKTFMMQRKNT
ncbi:MAG TPA: histidine kinase [Gammaproteobacteria bacterium]|nr:histidine kinase [Gammaproteobacteria bacterium]